LLGLQEPRFDPLPTHDIPGLNEHQEQAVRGAMSARDYFLIQGPPGTGKTSQVLCGLVRQLDLQGENQLVIAFTNRAVDEICGKLQEMGLSFIRLGRGDAPYYWSELSKGSHLQDLHERVANTRIFLSTQAMLANNLAFVSIKKFRTLIVDEASQLLEPQLAGLLPNFERFVLIGDDNQLPPVVLQNEADTECTDPTLQDIGLTNFRNPLFSRLLGHAQRQGWDRCHVMLTTQYRMHADIARFSNVKFYNGRLVPGTEAQQSPLPPGPQADAHPLRQAFTKARVTFLPSHRDPRAKVNDDEADTVVRLVRLVADMYGSDFSADQTIGVITPFRAQIANIRQRLPEHLRQITVDTVERFQGSERDVILISYAIKSEVQLRTIQSLNEAGVDRKLNVALTRARKNLVILGFEDALRSAPLFAQLLDDIAAAGGYLQLPDLPAGKA
jgi:DNA replication ATP-dependent helicase Dna2